MEREKYIYIAIYNCIYRELAEKREREREYIGENRYRSNARDDEFRLSFALRAVEREGERERKRRVYFAATFPTIGIKLSALGDVEVLVTSRARSREREGARLLCPRGSRARFIEHAIDLFQTNLSSYFVVLSKTNLSADCSAEKESERERAKRRG